MNLPSGLGAISLYHRKHEYIGTVKGFSADDRQWYIDNHSKGEEPVEEISDQLTIPGYPFIETTPGYLYNHPEHEDWAFIQGILEAISPGRVVMEFGHYYCTREQISYENFREITEGEDTVYLCDARNVDEIWQVWFAEGYTESDVDGDIVVIVPILLLSMILTAGFFVTIGRIPPTKRRLRS